MNGKADLRARLLATFRGEAREHVQALTQSLLSLDRGLPQDEAARAVEETYRTVHTLKGAARSVSRTDVEAVCRACESVLSPLARGRLSPSREVLKALGAAVDDIGHMLYEVEGAPSAEEAIRRLESGAAGRESAEAVPLPVSPVPPEPSASPGLRAPDTLRVATARLDTLLLCAEEMLAPRLAASERVADLRGLVGALSACRASLNGTKHGTEAGSPDRRSLASALRAVEAQARDLLGRLVRDERALAASAAALETEARQLRMSPASMVLELFPAMARDLARQQGKDVDWVAQGSDLEVDRKVLEAIKDPLIHLARNAVDHGIEPPDERLRAGKPRRGRISVALALLENGRIEVRVEDDGRGIEPAQVRAAAVRSRLLAAEEAEALTDDQTLQLVYLSGLSTSPLITDLSGHGLGLAIVKERVERLGGSLQLETQVGIGTAVSLILPATVATFHGLLVRAGGLLFLLPLDAIERVIRVSQEQIRRVEGRDTVPYREQPVPLASLGGLVGEPEPEAPVDPKDRIPCVILRSGQERLAVAVAEVFGEREVLVKELRPPLNRVRDVSGAGLLGSGQLALILRPADLVRSASEKARPTPPQLRPDGAQPLRILVVDDSITTRTMERNLLEAAGYAVQVAVDGAEAWTCLKTEPFDLVVSDVDMPRLDGFELTRRIRSDRSLEDMPVVLVTALESRDDKERGVEVGANAYVVKSSFDQSNLLEIIRRLA